MAEIDFRESQEYAGAGRERGPVTPLINWGGAVLSIGLIAGLSIWGYKLAVRDLSGIPVVRALEGPMRVQPDDPGGRQASHQGLAVNTVQSDGQAAPAAERLILAPEPIALLDTDAPAHGSAPVTQVADAADDADDDSDVVLASAPTSADLTEDTAPTTAEELALQVAANIRQSEPGVVSDASPDPVAATEPAIIPASVPGVSRSLKPQPRPDVDLAALARAAQVPTATDGVSETDPATITAGTRLVQLGAFDTAEDARAVWGKLITDFGDYFTGKSRVVQEAESGGRTFYRLRATGFADLSDARRFCSVLLAEEAACIPVVAR